MRCFMLFLVLSPLIPVFADTPQGAAPRADVTAEVKADLAIVLAPKYDIRDLEKKESAPLKARLGKNAQSYNAAILDLYLGPKFDAAAGSQSPVPALLRFLQSHDRKGTLDTARSLKNSLDNCLTFHDLVKDKEALFKLLSEKDAALVKKLVEQRKEVVALIASLEAKEKQEEKKEK